LTIPDRSKDEANHLWPQVLDDGDRIVFTLWSGGSFDDATIVLLSRATGHYRTLIDGGSCGRVARSGHLVFARGGSLFAVPFDRDRGEVEGSPVPVLNGVLRGDATGVAQFDVSDDGTLAYIPAGPEQGSFLTWSDHERNVERVSVEPRSLFGPRLSPDGSRLLVSMLTDIWVYDLNRDAFQRLTFRAMNVMAIWSADGSEIIYASTVAGEPTLYSVPAGGGEPRAITDGRNLVAFPGSESVLGDLAYRVAEGPGRDFDIWTMRRGEAGSAQPFVETPFNEDQPEFSPDGRFIAYVSDETGRSEVFVRTFPDSGAKWSVSSGEGTEPRWAPDGKSLYLSVTDRHDGRRRRDRADLLGLPTASALRG
jgi:Tol biopolymer transport system component